MKTWIQNLEQEVIEKMDAATKKRIAKRRIIWPADTLNLIPVRVNTNVSDMRKYMLLWIDQHTTGNFYLGGSQIGFADEKDELMFKLGFKSD